MAWITKTNSGRWKGRYRAPDGKTRSKNFKKKSDAEKWLRAEVGRRDRGEWVDPALGKTTFGTWAETAMRSRLHTRHSTQARDESYMRSLILPAFAPVELRRINTADLQGWVSELIGAGYAAETVRKAYSLLRSVLTAAVDSGLIAKVPGSGVKLPRIERAEMRVLSVDELGQLLGEIPDRYRLLTRVAAYTGLRFGESAGLRRGDIDPLRRSLTVRRGLVEVSGKLRVEEPKTKASRRTVALSDWLAEELAAHLNDGGEYVFTSPNGGPLRRGNFRSRVWRPATIQAGLEGLRWHDLRHTHVAFLIAAGVHPKTIQSRLGHSSIKTTLDTYGHLFEGIDEAAAASLPAPPAPSSRPQVIEMPRKAQ